jgi:hypothetical protein
MEFFIVFFRQFLYKFDDKTLIELKIFFYSKKETSLSNISSAFSLFRFLDFNMEIKT